MSFNRSIPNIASARLDRAPCLGILGCAVAGILLSEHLPCSIPLAAFAAICFALAAFIRRSAAAFWLLVLTAFFLRHDLDWHLSPGRLPIDLLSQDIHIIHGAGIVTSDPVPLGHGSRFAHSRFEIQVTSGAAAAPFPAQVYWAGPAPAWGDEVAFSATINPISPPRNPGEFNLAAYLARRGFFAELACEYPDENRILAHGKGNPILAWSRRCRAFLQRRLTLGLQDDPEISGLVETITLGLKEETSIPDRELFQHVGALHLFVVNGLHVALLAIILGLLLKPLGIRRRAFALVIIPILFAYALVTGLNPGSVRAAIMAAVMFGAAFAERRPLSFNTLAAAAIILLLWDTNELFKEACQFSFGVVFAIILFADLIQKPILPIGLPDPFLPRPLWNRFQQVRDWFWRGASGMAAVSIAASLGSFPFSAGYFNLMTPSGLVANLILVPIAFCILAEAIFSLLATLAGSLSLLFNNANWLLASAMLGVVHLFAMLPGGHFFVSVAPARQPECRITILDLEPGQAAVIQSRTSTWLVDCGSASSYYRIVRPFLQSRGVNHLDGLILTHGAAPSIGAAQDTIADFSPAEICESALTDRSPTRRDLNNFLAQSGHPKTLLESGDQFQITPSLLCTVLYPPAGLNARTAGDKSLVLRLDTGSARILLMSESAYTGEQWLIENSRDLHATVAVFGGQSDDLVGSAEFLRALHPIAAIRGAPHFAAPASQDRLWSGTAYRQGVVPFLQSQTGAVTIDLTLSTLTLSSFLTNQHITKQLVPPTL